MVLGGGGEHFEMNVRTLVSGKTKEANFAGFLRGENGFESSSGCKDSIWIGVSNDFVKLKQVDTVGLQAPKRFFELAAGRGFISSVDLCHQESLFAIAVPERFAHTNFALAAVVVPAVVQKVDALVESLSNNRDALVGIYLLTEVISADSNQRDFFAGAAELSIGNTILKFGGRIDSRKGGL